MKVTGWLYTVVAIVLPGTALAQEAPSAAPAQTSEIAIYVHHVGSVKRLVGTAGRVIAESRNFEQFITSIGGTAADVPTRNASEEQWNAAVLNVLARQGWQLVGCQMVTRIDDNYMYSCYLERPAPGPTGSQSSLAPQNG